MLIRPYLIPKREEFTTSMEPKALRPAETIL